MREIKFRIWSSFKKHFLTDYGSVFLRDVGDVYNSNYMEVSKISTTVQMFTGLKDKEGIDIYDGDIIKWDNYKEPEQVMNSLDWDGRLNSEYAPFMSAWGSTDGNYYKTFMNIFDPTRYSVVIGNIYENPELLTQQP